MNKNNKTSKNKSFRHKAAFGKRIEYWIIGRMLKEGFDIYVPLVDDNAIDVIIRKPDGSFITVQIKARSKDCGIKGAANFAAIRHDQTRDDYWFVFYSEHMDTTWLMTSKEFIKEAVQNKNGKNKGKRAIWFNGLAKGTPHCKPQYEKYLAADFHRLAE